MAITKVQLHGVADTAGELEAIFHRVRDELSEFIADKSPNEYPWEPMRDKKGNVLYAISDMKFTPKFNEFVHGENGEEMRNYVVGHATYTVWHG
jgi:hypothetical protein